jgi:hypothetical protein
MTSKLEKKLALIHDDVIVIKDRQSSIIQTLDEHKKVLYGNGKKGLIVEMALVWQKVALISVGVGIIVTAVINYIIK